MAGQGEGVGARGGTDAANVTGFVLFSLRKYHQTFKKYVRKKVTI